MSWLTRAYTPIASARKLFLYRFTRADTVRDDAKSSWKASTLQKNDASEGPGPGIGIPEVVQRCNRWWTARRSYPWIGFAIRPHGWLVLSVLLLNLPTS